MSDFTLDKADFIDLYKISIEEEHRELATHQTRIAFITGVISALFPALFIGIIYAKESYEFLFLCGGPVLIGGLAAVGRSISKQSYERFLSAITYRAKLEQKLGLTNQPHLSVVPTDAYWANEPFVPTRHLSSRSSTKYPGSADWLEDHLNTGYNRSVQYLLNGTIFGSFIVLVALILITWMKW